MIADALTKEQAPKMDLDVRTDEDGSKLGSKRV